MKLTERAKASHLALVAPYVGAWIETGGRRNGILPYRVAPYVGAWIETGMPTV